MLATEDIQAFVRVVERQSFSAAAATLGLTPSAVSKLVTRLENRLGVRLLHRTTRRLALTSEGNDYFSRARQILTDMEEMEAAVTRSRASPRGRLHVNTSNAFGIHQLAPALPDFLARYPDIKVELSISDRITDLVAEGADVTIRAGRILDTSFTALKISEFERTICAAPAYLAQHGIPKAPAELADHVCIVAPSPTSTHWPFMARDGVNQLEIVPRVTTDSGEAALRLALSGAGIVRLGDMLVGEPIRRGLLVPLLTESNYIESLPLSALYLAGRHRLPKVRVFLDFMLERFSSAPWRVNQSKSAPNATARSSEQRRSVVDG